MKFDAGFARITWEPEFGGRNGTSMQQIIFGQEEAQYRRADRGVHHRPRHDRADAPRACGTDAQKQRYLTKLLRGEEIWCQLFSEPGAGSDVASLSTTAVRDGDEWVVNGQKVWTSGAQYSDFGEIICRTNPDAEKHKGITAFIVDMQRAGRHDQAAQADERRRRASTRCSSTTCASRTSTCSATCNEGWTVAITTLMNERVAIGSGGGGGGRGERARPHRARPANAASNTDPVVRQQLADLYIEEPYPEVPRRCARSPRRRRARCRAPKGRSASSFGGRMLTRDGRARDRHRRRVGAIARRRRYRWHQPLLGAPAAHIAGGSDEVMKNIIGERVLGLPGEPRVDKGVPWRDVMR